MVLEDMMIGALRGKSSEGVHMTCFAVFLILLLPGAFVAFDNDTLQMLSHLQLLRIYCAGVWHNIVLCTVCWLSSMSLPVLLHVLYENGTNPVVLNVPTVSPLRGYLSAGDVISGLNGVPLHTPTEWIQELSLIHIQALKQHEITNAWSMNEQHIIAKQNASHANRGFCIPNDWLLLNPTMEGGSIDLGCSNGDLLFIEIPYSSHNYTVFQPTGNLPGVKQHFFCLRAKDVVQLPKCGHGWVESVTYQRHYCTKNEFCMDPVLPLGSVLIEVEHYKTSIPECLLQHNHAKPPNMSIPSISQEDKITSCKSSLLYEGNAAFLAHSVHLTGYKPQILTFLSTPLLWLPTILERLLKITFYVSAALALLNSAPIFYLDGQFILETILSYTHLKKRRFVLYFLLMCGTTLFLMSTLGGFRLLLFMA